MSMKRIWALFVARNYEFIRDRAGFGWNILFPFLIVAGFGLVFNSDNRRDYKIGVFPASQENTVPGEIRIPEVLKESPYIKIVGFKTLETAMERLKNHKIDLLVKNPETASGLSKLEYWVSDSSPKGYVLEKMVKVSVLPEAAFDEKVIKKEISGRQIRYIDWLFPGIISMNIMFSALFGVGYVIVRYRRIGVLKRLKATPVTAFDYLTAQMASRLLVLISSTILVWFGCDLIFSFQMYGSYFDIFVVFLAGCICLTSLGLILACRGTNEELTNGFINFICWPMMFLSEVWFSIEGSSAWVKSVANALPLTHFLSAARKVINDGAGLAQVSFELTVLMIMTLVFLTIGSVLFSWTR